jgi:hypothetical protein
LRVELREGCFMVGDRAGIVGRLPERLRRVSLQPSSLLAGGLGLFVNMICDEDCSGAWIFRDVLPGWREAKP